MTNWTEVGMLVSLCGATFAVILHALFRSKCTHIHCGCIECKRQVSATDLKDPTIPPDPPVDSPSLYAVRLNQSESALQIVNSPTHVRREVAKLNALH